MVQLPVVQRVYDELSWITEAFEHLKSLIIYAMRTEVLRYCAVVVVGQTTISVGLCRAYVLRRLANIVEKVLDVYDIYVPDLLHWVGFLLG